MISLFETDRTIECAATSIFHVWRISSLRSSRLFFYRIEEPSPGWMNVCMYIFVQRVYFYKGSSDDEFFLSIKVTQLASHFSSYSSPSFTRFGPCRCCGRWWTNQSATTIRTSVAYHAFVLLLFDLFVMFVSIFLSDSTTEKKKEPHNNSLIHSTGIDFSGMRLKKCPVRPHVNIDKYSCCWRVG